MSDDKRKTRAKLLNELESIKTLLKDDELQDLEPPILTNAIDDIDNAPLLTDIHEDHAPAMDEVIPTLEEAVPPPAELEKRQEEVAEQQQSSLVDVANEAPATTGKTGKAPAQPKSPTLSSGRGDNPFLPKHIRDRIAANRKQSAMMATIPPVLPAAAAAQHAEPSDSSTAKPDAPSDEQLIDDMVQRFLPAIEAALRERLEALIHEQRDPQEDDEH